MNSRSYALILSAAAVLFTAACSQKKAPVPADGSAAVSGPKLGTSDSGGGTGVEGKMFESYIVDPMVLPAYKEHLATRMSNIKSNDGDSLDQVFKIKLWYIAPIELDKIEKGLLGVSFMKNSTTQIARQKMREVWISKGLYDAMMPDTLAQATTLAHEWVMALYMMKFMTFTEVCRAVQDVGGSCGGDTEGYDKMAPAQQPRALDDEDNENIRYVTDWFMRNTLKPIDQKAFLRVLVSHGFDKRFFDPRTGTANKDEKPLKMSQAEFVAALQGSKITGTMPDQCTGISNEKKSLCKLEFTAEDKNRLGIRVSVPGLPALKLRTYLSDEIELTQSGDVDVLDQYTTSLFVDTEKHHVGDRTYMVVLVFDKTREKGQIELRSVILRAGVIVSIDKQRDPVCYMRLPKVENLLDDGLMIQRLGFETLYLERYYAGMSPISLCNTGNVD